MQKKKKNTTAPRKGKKGGKPITTTSVAFKTENLEALKAHPLHQKKDLSISWIVNKLVEKFRAGVVTIDID